MITASQSPTALSPEVEEERRAALRALLRNPLLPAVGETAKEYVLVRRHSVWLKYWLAKFAAWDLHLDKEVARLRKTPADVSDGTRPAIDGTSGSPFSRRRYALLCLALAALERSERQTTLGRIAETIMEFVASDPEIRDAGLVFDISNHDQRRDLVHTIRLLMNLGLVRRIDGNEQEFLNRTGALDALYEINRAVLAVMLNVTRSPSAIEATEQPFRRTNTATRTASLIEDLRPENEESRNHQLRAKLARTLLDDPVLYLRDLSDEERAYLQRQRSYLLRQIREATGLVPEARREGIAMVDNAGDLTDLRLPEEGTDGHLGLLLAAWFAEQLKRSPGTIIPFPSIEDHVKDLIRVHGSKWRKAAKEPGAESRLTEETLLRLRWLRLIRITSDGIVPLAAVGRYATAPANEKTKQE
jgi:uncharacterized protein (TIGR02678 family)